MKNSGRRMKMWGFKKNSFRPAFIESPICQTENKHYNCLCHQCAELTKQQSVSIEITFMTPLAFCMMLRSTMVMAGLTSKLAQTAAHTSAAASFAKLSRAAIETLM
jgi:hypothetical protein